MLETTGGAGPQQAAAEKRLECAAEPKLLSQKRQVKLRTCADVYAHWRAYKRAYRKAPREGVEFQIDYIDTGLALGEEERARAPVALALHGAPGSYHDFSLLIQHLSQQRVRVIAPNFPEYIATVKTKVLFRHSADEKAAYLRDFLRAINVTTIDLLVSHSSAIFPTLLILLNANRDAVAARRGGGGGEPEAELEAAKGAIEVEFERESGGESDSESESESDADTAEAETFEDASAQLDDNNNNERAAANGEPGRKGPGARAPASEPLGAEENKKKQEKNTNEGTRHEHQQKKEKEKEEEEKKNKKKKKRRSKKNKKKSLEPIVQFQEPIEIRAVALFNPAGHRMPKSMKPVWFKCGAVHVYQQKLGRSIFRKFGPAFLTVIGEVVRVENMDHVMLSATVMRNSKCQRVVSQLEQLSRMQIPTLLVFSENDKLIEKEIFYEMTQFMRLEPKNFDVFQNEADVELSQSRNVNDWIRVMVFKAGGHYAYSNYAKTVNTAVSELLAKVRGKPGAGTAAQAQGQAPSA